MNDFYYRLHTRGLIYSCRARTLLEASAQCGHIRVTRHEKYETPEQLFAFMDKEKVCQK